MQTEKIITRVKPGRSKGRIEFNMWFAFREQICINTNGNRLHEHDIANSENVNNYLHGIIIYRNVLMPTLGTL